MNDTATATAPVNLFKDIVTSRLQRASDITLMNNWHKDNLGKCYLLLIKHYKGKNKDIYDQFLKIGYSATYSIESRLSWMPQCFKIEVLGEVIMDKCQALQTEQTIHKYFRGFRYIPRHSRWSGSNECYRLSLLDKFPTLNAIIDALPELIKAGQINTPQSLN